MWSKSHTATLLQTQAKTGALEVMAKAGWHPELLADLWGPWAFAVKTIQHVDRGKHRPIRDHIIIRKQDINFTNSKRTEDNGKFAHISFGTGSGGRLIMVH